MEKKKKNAEKKFNTQNIVLSALCGCLVGFVLILCADKTEAIAKGMPTVLNGFGSLLISISSGSLLLEWFGYVNYTRKRMCEVLCEDEVIKVLDLERKKELKSALIKNIYMSNAPELQNEENNISTIMDNEMDNILQEYYFEEYIIYVDLSVIEHEGKKYFKKKMRHTLTAKTVNKQNSVLNTLISAYLKPCEGIDPLKIQKFTVNNKEIDCKSWKLTDEDNRDELKDTYTKKYTMNEIIENNRSVFEFIDKIDVDFEYTTIVEIDDNVYSYQIQHACKHFCIHINVPQEYKIIMEGFGFMSLGNSKRQRLIETENGCMLRFLDWILPGNGIMAVFQKK